MKHIWVHFWKNNKVQLDEYEYEILRVFKSKKFKNFKHTFLILELSHHILGVLRHLPILKIRLLLTILVVKLLINLPASARRFWRHCFANIVISISWFALLSLILGLIEYLLTVSYFISMISFILLI